MANLKEKTAFHRNRAIDGRELSPEEREQLLKPYLPLKMSSASSSSSSSSSSPSAKTRHRKVVRPFVQDKIQFIVYTTLHFFFSIYIRLRFACHAIRDRFYAIIYYHHRTPEYIQKDVRNLKRLPEHLSVVLEIGDNERNLAGLERLLNDVGEIAAWCVCAGVPALSVYERSGILKRKLESTHHSITETFRGYFSPSNVPTLSVGAPSQQSYSPPFTPPSPESTASGSTRVSTAHLKVLLLGEDDGRSTLVDLTKIFAEMAQKKKIEVNDITADLIHTEISQAVMNEPDLLILFAPHVILHGYPPWHLRLTEIFHVPDNTDVEYQVFIRALHRYAKAQMRVGR